MSPGLYQFNLTVPEVPDGDMPITAQIGAIQSSIKAMVSVNTDGIGRLALALTLRQPPR